MSVLDAIGEPVVSALKVPGTSVTFTLPPKTYAARVTTPDQRVGRVKAPIELYGTLTEQIELRERGRRRAGLGGSRPGSAHGRRPRRADGKDCDPLARPARTAEIRDEAGQRGRPCYHAATRSAR